MSDINWNEGAVCYGDGRQWFVNEGSGSEKFELFNDGGSRKYSLYGILNYPKDFQLNEIREGDFIPASELETEQKYNEAVEVFGLFGIAASVDHRGFCASNPLSLVICDDGYVYTEEYCKRQLTYNQIIAIGKLKRMMLERGKPATIDENSVQAKLSNIGNVLHNLSCLENDEDLQGELYNYASYLWDLSKSMVNEKSAPKTAPDLTPDKSKQAYDILKSLDYEYDLVKQKWFKKQYID